MSLLKLNYSRIVTSLRYKFTDLKSSLPYQYEYVYWPKKRRWMFHLLLQKFSPTI